jgi:hypothetical protein
MHCGITDGVVSSCLNNLLRFHYYGTVYIITPKHKQDISNVYYVQQSVHTAASFDKSSYKKAVYFIRQSQRLKSYYRCFMSMICSQAVQCEPVISVNRNKDKYKQYRRRLCYLTQNIHHDAVSGWLMLVSFYYQMKQYDTVLYIIYYALSPEKKYSIKKSFRVGNTN